MTKDEVIPILISRGWHVVTKRKYRNSFDYIDVWCHGGRHGSYTYREAKKIEGLR